MKRLFFLMLLILLSPHSYAMSYDEIEYQERAEFMLIAFPWAILFFLAIGSISDSKRYLTAIQILIAVVGILSLAWVVAPNR
ncbi:hypothetical protein [Vibrio alginolyticus]|uniref:hypothetical protein n=1 Tax=Vibrio alginolyticus TaxID=663 RepID=UPI002119D03A|nr:hypothetical protein [Vibrio alginolyticus]MCQ9091013.1 hypothetical protein [Vibrio alginolyticus]